MPKLSGLSTTKTLKTGGGGWFVIYNNIPAVIAAVEAGSRAAVKAKADEILRNAKSKIHRLTGELQDTAYAEVIENGKSATINFPSEHAAPVEYGTYKMSARPYLYPAMLEGQDGFFNSIGADLFNGI